MVDEYTGATPQGMLRGSANDKRMDRETIDTGTGTKRISGNRAEHMGRGNFVNFYDDLGISATPDSANTIRSDEAQFQGQVKEQRGALDEAQGRWNDANKQVQSAQSEIDRANAGLDKTASQIPGFDEAYNKAFDAYKAKNLVNVAVITGQNVEAYYAVPAGVVHEYAKTGQFWINPASNGVTYIETHGKGGEKYGNNLHVGLGTAAIQVENEFSKQASPLIAKELGAAYSAVESQRGQLSGAYSTLAQQKGELATAQSQIDSNKAVLDETVNLRKQQWNEIHAKYENRKNTMKEIFGGFKVE